MPKQSAMRALKTGSGKTVYAERIRIEVMAITPYKGGMIYIRRIGMSIFEYLVVWKGLIYNAHNIITPGEGKTKMTKAQAKKAAGLTFLAAQTTIEELIKKEQHQEEVVPDGEVDSAQLKASMEQGKLHNPVNKLPN